MPCYHPVEGWLKKRGGVTFSLHDAYTDKPTSVPCGQCVGCRLERSRQWAVRIMHEASLHDRNAFVTLTYSDANLPIDGSLRVEDFQKFMKRLRKEIAPTRVRYYHVGEYGETLERPHYHACLFGYDFSDKSTHCVRGQHQVWRSPSLERLWDVGYSELGSVTFESAAYVARYITKKVTGKGASAHYGAKRPEYSTMSRRPGIGHGWLDRYGSEVYPTDEVIVRGKQQRPPRYYDLQLEKESPELMEEIKRARRRARDWQNSTRERLEVREEVTVSRLSTYGKRGYEQ